MIVESGSALTYLVFHHALRIRLKGESLDLREEKKGGKDVTPSTNGNTQSTTTPATTDTNVASSEEASDADTATPTTAVDDDSTNPMVKNGQQKKTGHLIGKINNLITSDLTSVAELYEICQIREFRVLT